MCHLHFSPPGTVIAESWLRNSATTNRDGNGWAAVLDGELVVFKSMNLNEAVTSFLQFQEAHPDTARVWHTRFGTAGEDTIRGVHPHFIGKRGKGKLFGVIAGAEFRTNAVALFHNGILPSKYQPKRTDFRSDTRLYAETVLPGLGDLSQAGVQAKIAKDIGGGNKFIVIDARAGRTPVTIINEDSGHWTSAGTWASNSDHLGYSYGVASGNRNGMWIGGAYREYSVNGVTYAEGWGWDEEDMVAAAGKAVSRYSHSPGSPDFSERPSVNDPNYIVRCKSCGGEDLYSGLCCDCATCIDCGGDFLENECQCHLPAHMVREATQRMANSWWSKQDSMAEVD